MLRLIIDDCRVMDIPDGVNIHARTNESAIEHLKTEKFDEVWFDYDMGKVFGRLETEYESTILPTVDWLKEQDFNDSRIEIGQCVIHTANPVGRKQIQLALAQLYPLRHIDAAIYTVETLKWDT